MRSLGALVRSSRERLHLTQAELARRVGVSRSEISEIEAGRIKQPSASVFAKLCDALGLPGALLLGATGYIVADAVGYLDSDELLVLASTLVGLAGSERKWLRERLTELRDLLLVRRGQTKTSRSVRPRLGSRSASSRKS